MAGVDDFILSITDFGKGLDRDVSQLQKKIFIELIPRVVFRTPVDTGLARGNWIISLDAPVDIIVEPDPNGQLTVDNALAMLENIRPFQNIFFQNNVPYIEFLELGSSSQAPGGMVALSIEEVLNLFP